MNDIDVVRDLRAEMPLRDAARMAEGRARLLAATAATRPRAPRTRAPRTRAPRTRAPRTRAPRTRAPRIRPSRTRRARLITVAASAVAVCAAAVAAYALIPAPGPGAAHPAAKAGKVWQRATLAARILRQASATVERVSVTAEPAPGQWIYAKTIDYEPQTGTTTSENWMTFDGARTAYYASPGGPLVEHTSSYAAPDMAKGTRPLAAFSHLATPKTAYDALASLPSNPSALLAQIAEAAASASGANIAAGDPVAGSAPRNQAQLEFDYLTELLWNAAGGMGGPPKAEADAFLALAALPGISVQQGVRDAAGTEAIAVSDDGGYSQLLLDQRTYQVLGLRQLSNGTGVVSIRLWPASLRKEFVALPTAQEKQQFMREHQQLFRKLARQFGPPNGTVEESLAYAQVSEVPAPGDR
jgi:hypothetical protein